MSTTTSIKGRYDIHDCKYALNTGISNFNERYEWLRLQCFFSNLGSGQQSYCIQFSSFHRVLYVIHDGWRINLTGNHWIMENISTGRLLVGIGVNQA